ncbi:hypothetical protein AB9F45_38250, partial [Rhizobium leguminosarum]|uniref:hypothetical protein n=1 Tax=Rhizobium leguminosarum TaxID=384 RepID=UPI003F9B52F2
AMFNLEDRGPMIIEPGEKVYAGMIICIHSSDNDLEVNVDDDFLDRLKKLAVFILVHHEARTRHGKLEAFATHGFDENSELK